MFLDIYIINIIYIIIIIYIYYKNLISRIIIGEIVVNTSNIKRFVVYISLCLSSLCNSFNFFQIKCRCLTLKYLVFRHRILLYNPDLSFKVSLIVKSTEVKTSFFSFHLVPE